MTSEERLGVEAIISAQPAIDAVSMAQSEGEIGQTTETRREIGFAHKEILNLIPYLPDSLATCNWGGEVSFYQGIE